jgi:hypothetical protein
MDLLRPALGQIIDMGHPLVRLAGNIDWTFLDGRFSSVRAPGPDRAPFGGVEGAFLSSVGCVFRLPRLAG